MPYDRAYFRQHGLYLARESNVGFVDLNGGRVVPDLLPQTLREKLQVQSDSSKGEDYSRQDSAIITAMLSSGLSPEDTYATFSASVRGKFAAERKEGHVDDYLSRTISKAVEFLNNGNRRNGTHVKVDFSKKRRVEDGEGILSTMADTIDPEKVHWTWYPYIPSGKITIIAGDPGMGKSTIGLDLISRISRGTFLPTGDRTIAGTCLIASAEDAPADTIIPRLIAADANLPRCGVIGQVRIDDELRYLCFPRDLVRLRNLLVKKGARILVIDPFNAFLEKGTDTYKDQDVRSVLAPLETISEETGTSIIIIAHLNKKEDAGTLYRVGGSIGFIGAARSVLAVTSAPRGDFKILYSIKSNLAARPRPLAYNTYQRTRFVKGEKVNASAIRWRGEIDFDPMQTGTSDAAQVETDTEQFLRQVLADSEVSTEDIFREAREAGIQRSQLGRIRVSLGIKTTKKRDGRWYWQWGDQL